MSSLDAARLLRHRAPALLLGTTEARESERLRCRGIDDGAWPWPRLLEATAQVAGLLTGLQPGGPPNTAAIAEFRDVVIHEPAHEGPVVLEARLERRLLHFWRCRVTARATDEGPLLEAVVTIAPPSPAGAGNATAPDVAVRRLLAAEGFGDDLFNPTQHECCTLVDRYVVVSAAAVVAELGLGDALARGATSDELIAMAALAPGFAGTLAWLLDLLVTGGIVRCTTVGGPPRYVHAEPGMLEDRDALRARALAIDPAYRPVYALVDAAARIYVQAAHGADADALLLRRIDLWTAYFTNANPYYALNNRVAARAAARRLRSIPDARVLEVGAGLGSAAAALLEEVGGSDVRLARYTVTEPVDPFRRRAERTLEPFASMTTLHFAPLDIDRPWAEQGFSGAGTDLVWGVNVFHLARNLQKSLAEARAVLAPGGWIVIGEGLRPALHTPVPAEFPFRLLRAWHDVALEPVLRPGPGFLTAERWAIQLRFAGFTDVATVPAIGPLQALQPLCYPAAILGRRP